MNDDSTLKEKLSSADNNLRSVEQHVEEIWTQLQGPRPSCESEPPAEHLAELAARIANRLLMLGKDIEHRRDRIG